MKIKFSTDNPLSKSSSWLSLILAVVSAAGPTIAELDVPTWIIDAMPAGIQSVVSTVAFLLIFIARCTAIVKE